MKKIGQLSEAIQKRMESERIRIQQETEEQYKKLQTELDKEALKILAKYKSESSNLFKDELNTITNAMERNNQMFKRYLGKQIAWLVLAAGSLCLGISFGSWAMTSYLSSQIQSKQEQLNQLDREIIATQQTLEQLEKKTKGITITSTNNGTFITLPPYKELKEGWRCQGKPCLKME